ncbi:hypothetical protein GOB57_09380 [Sinorhizobium meliloti]|nr:hypothetical protein [Sinorhizobium meliloti]
MDKETIKSFEFSVNEYLKSQVEWIERGRPRLPDGPDMLSLLCMSVGRVLTNFAVRYGSPGKAFMEVSMDDMRHIYDWLLVASMRGEAWLSRCDDQGRPLKLLKFGTIQQILAEANKAMAKRRGDGFRVPAGEGVEVVHDCGHGWTVVRLKTPGALDHEGHVMGHCVGQGAYDLSLSTNFTGIYSLRDPFGKSHVTIEIDHAMDVVQQIKGKQNKPPKAEYMRRLLGWRGLKDVSVAGTELPSGFCVEKTRGIVELSSLKAGDVFEGTIGIVLKDHDDYTLDIPAGVTIRGDVVVQGQRAGKLVEVGNVIQMLYPKVAIPEEVFVDGFVRLDHVTLDRLSVVARRLIIRNSTVHKIEDAQCDIAQFGATTFAPAALDGASFRGSVEMQACRGVVFLPTTRIGGSVSIAGCRPGQGEGNVPIEFSDHFEARRRLSIFNSLVSFGNLSVDGSLDIEKSSVLHMPSILSVTGDFSVEDSLIDKWPETLNVHGTVREKSVETNELAAATTDLRAMR